jgi:hypothetical protein
MELVDAHTLARHVAQGPIPLERALAFGRQVAGESVSARPAVASAEAVRRQFSDWAVTGQKSPIIRP